MRPAFSSLLKWYSLDRKSTRLNSSHVSISYAVFCFKKKTQREERQIADSREPLRELSVVFRGARDQRARRLRPELVLYLFLYALRHPPRYTLLPYPPLFR